MEEMAQWSSRWLSNRFLIKIELEYERNYPVALNLMFSNEFQINWKILKSELQMIIESISKEILIREWKI